MFIDLHLLQQYPVDVLECQPLGLPGLFPRSKSLEGRGLRTGLAAQPLSQQASVLVSRRAPSFPGLGRERLP